MTVDISRRIGAVMALEPAAPAIAQDGHWRSWGDLTALGGQVTDLTRDIPQDAAVGLVARNDVAIVACLLDLFARGRAALTLDPLQSDSSLAAEIVALRPAFVLLIRSDWEREGIADVVREAGTRAIVVECGTVPRAEIVEKGESVATGGPGEAGEYCRLSAGCAVSLKTSGTTGPPKRIEISYASLSASITAVQKHHGSRSESEVALRPGVTIQMLALAHTSALQSLCVTVADGRQLVLMERFDPTAWAKVVRDYKVVTTGVPPAGIRMVLDAGVDPSWLQSLKSIRAGAAPLDPAVADEFLERFGVPVLSAYGATEFQGLASWTLKDYRRYAATKKGAVGRVHPGVEVRVVDTTSNEVLPTGGVGILEVRTEQSSRGEPREWIQTSDLARYDEDQFLWILGRVDGAINRGGFKVDAAEVARVLREHPQVGDAAVVGAPDRRLGEVPVAVVQPKPGGSVPEEAELKAWVRARLEPYKVPTVIVGLEAIPQTIAMKPDKRAILARLGYSPDGEARDTEDGKGSLDPSRVRATEASGSAS